MRLAYGRPHENYGDSENLRMWESIFKSNFQINKSPFPKMILKQFPSMFIYNSMIQIENYYVISNDIPISNASRPYSRTNVAVNYDNY